MRRELVPLNYNFTVNINAAGTEVDELQLVANIRQSTVDNGDLDRLKFHCHRSAA